jgi:hypothetical protein
MSEAKTCAVRDGRQVHRCPTQKAADYILGMSQTIAPETEGAN